MSIDPLRSALIFSMGVLCGAGITAFLQVMQVLLLSRRRGSNPPPPGRKPAPPPSPPDRDWRRSFNHENTNRPTSEPPLWFQRTVRLDEGRVQRGNGNGGPSTAKPAIMPKPQCPPLGLKPRWLADEQRLQEVADAINRYREAGVAIPLEWLDEAAVLGRRLQHCSPPQPHGGRMAGPGP